MEEVIIPRLIFSVFLLKIANILRHIGLLEADEDKIRKIRPKGTLVTILYVPREAREVNLADKTRGATRILSSSASSRPICDIYPSHGLQDQWNTSKRRP